MMFYHCLFVCLYSTVTKYLTNCWMDCDELLLVVYLKLVKVFKQPCSRWSPQLFKQIKQKNLYNYIIFTGTELEFGVTVAESHTHHIIQTKPNKRCCFQTLSLNIGVCLLAKYVKNLLMVFRK